MEPLKNPKALLEYPLCIRCLGRGFAKLGHGLSNLERGEFIIEQLKTETGRSDSYGAVPTPIPNEFEDVLVKITESLLSITSDDLKNSPATMELTPVEPKNCWLCEGLMAELEDFASILSIPLKDFEFDNFLVGSKVDDVILAREETLWLQAGLSSPESIKAELNREIGKILNTALEKPTEFSKPDVVALIDTRFNVGEIQPSPLFIYGRYLKLKRGIPQTKWYCRKCRGRGCKHCNNTGKMYDISVEELIAEPAVKFTGAGEFALHGMGREDIDVMMLGNGRPFVLELSKPHKRKIDFEKLSMEINQDNAGLIEVRELRSSSREEMIAIKMSKNHKSYRCRISTENTVPNEKLKMVVNTFVERVITQRTPIRVSHRRADKYRKKKVYDIRVAKQDIREIVLEITGESGLYIKELIHGDDTRTQPNLSDELGIKCNVIELDVIKIHDDNTTNQRSD